MALEIDLLRHAQSADKQSGQTDKQRVLTPMGKQEATWIGNFLKHTALAPELILASSATRALETASIVQEILSFPMELFQYYDELYEADNSTYWNLIKNLGDHYKRVLFVGHNPAISHLAQEITNVSIALRPCELVQIQLIAGRWKETTPGTGKLTGSFYPDLHQR